MKKIKFTGGCFCGDVRYRLSDEPMFVQCCHCTECQRQTGGPFVINALIETCAIKIQRGQLEKVAMSKGKEAPHDIYRCKKCKVALWSDYGRRKWIRFVRVMTLDQRSRVKPGAHIFVKTKLPWVQLPEGTPVFPVYYDLKRLWPKQSLERRQHASAACM